MKHPFPLTAILVIAISLGMAAQAPFAFASSSTDAKEKVGEMEKALGEADNAATREKAAEDDWFKKQSEDFQSWQDAEKKEEEARAAREKADGTGKEEDIKAAERAEKIAQAAQKKADASNKALGAAAEVLEKAKEAKQKAKEKAAGTVAPAEKAVDKLPESSVKDKLEEKIKKVKEDLKKFALAPKTPEENIFAKADLAKGQDALSFGDSRLNPAGIHSRDMQFDTSSHPQVDQHIEEGHHTYEKSG